MLPFVVDPHRSRNLTDFRDESGFSGRNFLFRASGIWSTTIFFNEFCFDQSIKHITLADKRISNLTFIYCRHQTEFFRSLEVM